MNKPGCSNLTLIMATYMKKIQGNIPRDILNKKLGDLLTIINFITFHFTKLII